MIIIKKICNYSSSLKAVLKGEKEGNKDRTAEENTLKIFSWNMLHSGRVE